MSQERRALERRLAALVGAQTQRALQGSRIGLEKEGLRVTPDGTLSRRAHPEALGSALTHPAITTDFSEAMLELITPPLDGAGQARTALAEVHGFVYRQLEDELIWATSMPCVLDGAASIPLARYGSSNAATMKTVYRRGLGHRYGRIMQVIAGIHFNYSFDEQFWSRYQQLCGDTQRGDHGQPPVAFRAAAQMGMLRNLQRIGWLVPYLFGASPVVCESFVAGRETDLERFDDHTLYYPYATSLRMGDIGYQNKQEAGSGIKASYDGLKTYVDSLTRAMNTPCPLYSAIPLRRADGRYEQLNANILQIENEYYSTVRPKQPTGRLESPSLALRRRGIGYIELRSLDIDPFEPTGVGLEQLRFLEVLMLTALLFDSPLIDARESAAIDENLVLTAHLGRAPGLKLMRCFGSVALRDWAHDILAAMLEVAELFDGAAGGVHAASVRAQMEKVAHPEATPSARILAMLRERRECFFDFAKRVSLAHREHFLAQVLAPARQREFARMAADSWREQYAIEAADDRDFDTFLADYYAQNTVPAEAMA